LHECQTAADQERVGDLVAGGSADHTRGTKEAEDFEYDEGVGVDEQTTNFNEEALQAIIRSQTSVWKSSYKTGKKPILYPPPHSPMGLHQTLTDSDGVLWESDGSPMDSIRF